MPVHKRRLGSFLRRNPFGHPFTEGFFYREKMRAIHRVAPDEPYRRILEVGGGQSGLTALLYPTAEVVNLDFEHAFAGASPNRELGMHFICGDAVTLPFPDCSFDAVTMFDLLEHVPDHAAAAAEGMRVLRPGGVLLVSSPNRDWRFPFYRPLKPFCPSEEEMFAKWGHVRRGYSLDELEALTSVPCRQWATFINPVTVVCHDIGFSRLPGRIRRVTCTAISPITWLGYALHRSDTPGTETASAWRRA